MMNPDYSTNAAIKKCLGLRVECCPSLAQRMDSISNAAYCKRRESFDYPVELPGWIQFLESGSNSL